MLFRKNVGAISIDASCKGLAFVLAQLNQRCIPNAWTFRNAKALGRLIRIAQYVYKSHAQSCVVNDLRQRQGLFRQQNRPRLVDFFWWNQCLQNARVTSFGA